MHSADFRLKPRSTPPSWPDSYPISPQVFSSHTKHDPLARLLRKAGEWAPLTHLFISCCALCILAIIDLATGSQSSLSVFFLIPLATCAWFVNRPGAVALATIAGFVWFLDEKPHLIQSAPSSPLLIWHCASRVGIFLVAVWLITALRELFNQQRQLAETDDLTGLANRRSFDSHTVREISRATRSASPISLIFFDADRFKLVNDRFGHAAGDELLKTVASQVVLACRSHDIIARLGGDEFGILLPETDGPSARIVAEKIRIKLLEAMEHHRWPVTFSFGVVTFTSPPSTPSDMLRLADELQYTAKRQGRDAIVCSVEAKPLLQPAAHSRAA
jgi:diguanylate cyclase (GGDEF)-like protein